MNISMLFPILLASSTAAGKKTSAAEQILQYISEHPGSPQAEIVKALGISRGSVAYHLRNLTAQRYINVIDTAGIVGYYPHTTSFDNREAALNAFRMKETTRKILNQLRETPSLSRHELAHALDVKETTLTRPIADMLRCGVLCRKRDGHKWRYSITGPQKKE